MSKHLVAPSLLSSDFANRTLPYDPTNQLPVAGDATVDSLT